MSQITLYQRPGAWGLPSLSPADTQVQTYLQLAGLRYSTSEVQTVASSPTEQLPALEHGAELIGSSNATDGDFESARLLLRYLKERVQDLDRSLTADQQAEVLALTSLVELHLEAATVYTTWCEDISFNQYTKKEYGAALPFPLNRWEPSRTRQRWQQHYFKASSAKQIYDSAGRAYASLAKQLQEHYGTSGSNIEFFFGDQPSTLDAVLYPHLLYQLTSPVAAPELREKLETFPILAKYVEAVGQATQNAAARRPPAARGGWERPPDTTADRQETAADRKLKQNGKMWLAAAGVAVVAYVIFSGQFVSLDYGYDEEDEEEE